MATNTLASLVQKATLHRAEASLIELFQIFQLDEEQGVLSKVMAATSRLTELGLRLTPTIEQGDLDTVRRVEILERPKLTEAEVLGDLRLREAEDLELKSSLLYDHNRAKAEPDAALAQLKSEAVLYSTLRTIAGFLTCSGGRLYVGANDQGEVIGIENDFPFISENRLRRNPDQWELHLRNHIQERFKDGIGINNYVSCEIIPVRRKSIARIEVAPRKRLAFLRDNRGWHLYRRQGNRTVEVSIDLVEEFIESRKVSAD